MIIAAGSHQHTEELGSAGTADEEAAAERADDVDGEAEGL